MAFDSYILFTLLAMTLSHSQSSQVCEQSVCEYEFVVHAARTMTYTTPDGAFTFDVALNGSRLVIAPNDFRTPEKYKDYIGREVPKEKVVTADGYPRNVILVNGRMPGPTIQVMEGAQVVVRVHNMLYTQVLTLHWHGLTLLNNVWMDGVPHVSQCPIQPGQSFTYRFKAWPPGTHWYHSHMIAQRTDGLYGFIIVHQRPPMDKEFTVAVSDWFHEDSTSQMSLSPFAIHHPGTGSNYVDQLVGRRYSQDDVELSAIKFTSALINGRGRASDRLVRQRLPLETFAVDPDKPNRFRVLNAGLDYMFEISVDGHNLTVVATDGFEISPVLVDSLIISPGERVDFILNANQKPAGYWLRANILTHRISRHGPQITERSRSATAVKAVIIYAGVESLEEPQTKPRCSKQKPCTTFNCPFLSFPQSSSSRTCINIGDVKSRDLTSTVRHHAAIGERYDKIEEHFLNFGLNGGSNINGRRYVGPSGPLFQTDSTITKCKEGVIPGSMKCTHELRVTRGRPTQLVLSAIQPGFDDNTWHAVHLHGHFFSVVKVGYPTYNDTTGEWLSPNEDILCESAFCTRPQWRGSPQHDLDRGIPHGNPPVKDTVVIPARGYVVVRLLSDNPGYWLLHCHQETHLFEGMDMILTVDPDGVTPVPRGFPTCKSFDWTDKEYEGYMEKPRDMREAGIFVKDNGLSSSVGYKDEILSDLGDSKTDTTLAYLSIAVVLLAATLLIGGATYCISKRRRHRQHTKPTFRPLTSEEVSALENNNTVLQPLLVVEGRESSEGSLVFRRSTTKRRSRRKTM